VDELTDRLLAFERALAERDWTFGDLGDLIADEFEEFGQSGRRLDRASVLEFLARPPGREVTIEGFSVDRLSDDVALATYTTGPTRTLRSSLWIRKGDAWRVRFHQGTPIPSDEAARPTR
jgi:ribonuclease HI